LDLSYLELLKIADLPINEQADCIELNDIFLSKTCLYQGNPLPSTLKESIRKHIENYLIK